MHQVNGPQVTHAGFFCEAWTVEVLEVFQNLSSVSEKELVELFVVFGSFGELVQVADLLPYTVHDLLFGLRLKCLSFLLFFHLIRARVLIRNILEHAPHPLSRRSDNFSGDSDVSQRYVVFPIHILNLRLP